MAHRVLNKITRSIEELFNISFYDQYVKQTTHTFLRKDIFPTQSSYKTEPLLTFEVDFDMFFGYVESAANADQHAHDLEERSTVHNHECHNTEQEVNTLPVNEKDSNFNTNAPLEGEIPTTIENAQSSVNNDSIQNGDHTH